MRQKKGRAGLFERVDYGVSSTKALCVIWTVEGGVKCADVKTCVKSREYDGTLLSAQVVL